MPLPKKYLALPSPAVPTINFADLAEGITIFNAYSANNTAAEQYLMTTAVPYSNLISSSGSVGVGTSYELDFDSGILNRPMILKGTCIANVTWKVTNSTGSNNNFPFAKLRKWNGTTETEIAEASGSIISSDAGAKVTSAIQIANIAATLIKSGEQIRMTIGVTGTTTGSSPKAHIAHDPQNRNNVYFDSGNVDTTKMLFAIPSKIA